MTATATATSVAAPADHVRDDVRGGRIRIYQSASGPFPSRFDPTTTYRVQVDADGVVSFHYSTGEVEVAMGLTARHVRAWADRGVWKEVQQ